MKTLLLSIPLLFCCIQDTVKTDSTEIQKPVKLFFEERTTEQITKDINFKLDLLLAKLQEKKDSTNLK